MEIGVYLPQVGFTWDELRARVVACDERRHRLGLVHGPPLSARHAAGAVVRGVDDGGGAGAATERVRFGHLVLCNGFRHPALLAKMAITLDHASGGRLELGLGSGSYAPEFAEFGLAVRVGERERAERLGEALEVLSRLFTEPSGVVRGRALPACATRRACRARCSSRIRRSTSAAPASGARCRWSARYADVWNCPTYALAELPRKLDVLRAECRRIGRDPGDAARDRGGGAGAGRAARSDRRRARARRAPLRRAPAGASPPAATAARPTTSSRRIARARRLGVDGFVFFLHDRAPVPTIQLLAREVLPAARAL